MTRRLIRSALFLATVTALPALAIGCKKHDIPNELVGSYTRSGGPSDIRAELSIARGGMVLTVMRLSASVDLGVFTTLFTGKNSVTGASGTSLGASADVGRNVAAARTFRALACESSSCRFELNAEGDQDACQGSFEKVQNTLIVVASGACQPYSGRWVLLESLPAETPPAPTTTAAGSAAPVAPPPSAPVTAGSATLEFPPDIPAPHDHMSCLQACSIVDTRCHRTSNAADSNAFLACVEKGQICRAKCEQVFPFFGGSPR